uniref:Uncharacterized protein n=1 Tax=Rhizophora mucronata TaxID=61149 RepID=A0A2P2NKE9_RHIMU
MSCQCIIHMHDLAIMQPWLLWFVISLLWSLVSSSTISSMYCFLQFI